MKLRHLPRFARFAISLTSALAFLVTPVRADAPGDQYNPYVRADLEIGDAKTFLSWRRSVAPNLMFSQATVTATSCPQTLGIVYRLPSMKELLTLVDELPHDEYENGTLVPKAIDRSAFPSTPSVEFWSGSEYAPNPMMAWVVDFKTGAARPRHKMEMHYVRCVR